MKLVSEGVSRRAALASAGASVLLASSAAQAQAPKAADRSLASGMGEDEERPLALTPANLELGENYGIWLFDDAEQVHVHVHLNALPGFRFGLWHEWTAIILPQGQAYLSAVDGGHPVQNGVGAAGASLVCQEPFRRWSLSHVGTALPVTATGMAAAPLDSGPIERPDRVPFQMEVEMAMTTPAWRQGMFNPMSPQVTAFMGGHRYEQLFQCRGVIQVGDKIFNLSGRGLRTHRQGARSMGQWLGHSWDSAVFPSGKAFALQCFPTASGGLLWQEALVTAGDELLPATVIEAPWLKTLQTHGEDFQIRLKSKLGHHLIEGTTLGAVYRGRTLQPNFALIQGAARYRMDGEKTVGLVERSNGRNGLNGLDTPIPKSG
jgi:hypothetical protein